MTRVLFIAGDASGDMHAARAAAQIKVLDPEAEILAIGGPALRRTADTFLLDLVDHSVVGFWEPLKKIPWFRKVLGETIVPAIQKHRPDVVVPVDFFGFNRFTARAAKEAGCRVCYFISPQIWASRPGRIAALKKVVDKMLVIFPFEPELYREHGVPAVFVGHPLLEAVPDVPEDAPARVEPTIGLLPGSRAGEVRRHLPLFLAAADRLAAQIPGARFVLFAAAPLSNEFYDRLLGPDRRRPYLLEIVRDENYRWRAGLDLALTCSGTASLENALLGVPMIVVYKMSWITYALARALIRVKHISMPNILAGEELVPELVQGRASPDALAQSALALWRDLPRRRTLRRSLLALRGRLGGPGAARRAAEEILALTRSPAHGHR
jgi:lipid-A-disaccharide synthase